MSYWIRLLFLAVLVLSSCSSSTASTTTQGAAAPTAAAPAAKAPTATSLPQATPTRAVPTPTGQAGKGVAPETKSTCPASNPIKGNVGENGKIYHIKGQSASYNATNPEACYATAADAEADGFRAAKN
jgi:hypothetical protein